MIAFLNLIPRWVLAAAIACLVVLSGVLALDLASARLQTSKAKEEVSQLKQAIADANLKAANESDNLKAKVIEAQNESNKREIELRANADSARSESDGLRNDLAAIRGKLATASRDAAVERATTIAVILQQCSERYEGLAEKADRHVNDIRTLIDAWPK